MLSGPIIYQIRDLTSITNGFDLNRKKSIESFFWHLCVHDFRADGRVLDADWRGPEFETWTPSYETFQETTLRRISSNLIGSKVMQLFKLI